MKKYIWVIFLLLISFDHVNADTVFTIDDITSSPGEEVSVLVRISDNPKFALLGFKVDYDADKLEYVSCTIKNIHQSMMDGCDNNDGAVTFYAITMYTDSDKLISASDEILVINFKIKDEITENIDLKLDITDYGASTEDELNYEVNDGIIRIADNITSVTVDEVVDLSEEITQDNITWESSNSSVAVVDDNGNVTFNDNGNVTITAIDDNGNVLFTQDYLVNETSQKGFLWIVIIVLGIIILGLIIYRVYHEKHKHTK